MGTRGCPQPGLCSHLERVHGAQWAHELAPRCPGPERAARGQPPGGQLRSEGRRPLLSFLSSTQALEPGLVSPLPGGETWARGQGGSVPQGRRSQRQGPWWASRRWRAAKDRAAEAAEGHLASEMPARVCGGPAVACGAELARAVRAPGQCPHARPPPAVPCPTLWPPGRACAWALRPPLFLSLLHPSPPGHPSAIWLPWILAATRAGSLNPWTVPEHGGGRALRVTGTDPPGSPALHRPPAPPCLAPAHCATLIRAGLGPVGRAPRPT